jgi:hypothetical protein
VFKCEFCAAKRAVWVRSSFHFVTVCGSTATSFQFGYRHLIELFQLLSVILPTRVFLRILSLFSHLLCRLPAISVLIHPLKSSGGYFSSFGIDSLRARLASRPFFRFWLFQHILCTIYISFSFIDELPNLSGLRIFRVVVSGCGHHGAL